MRRECRYFFSIAESAPPRGAGVVGGGGIPAILANKMPSILAGLLFVEATNSVP
jgi:hypothetical protein